MRPLRPLLLVPLLAALGGCTVYPAGSAYIGPPPASVYVAPRPYYAPPPRYGYGYRPYGYRPYGYRPYGYGYGYGYGGRRW
ncbi:hypothetical protein [Roseicella aerolata]|uniref:Lipoprotein n=1 Tax=Roseicella aerolata TaxID=2883479 RepID=A0A9X1II36_9PROT|nr:hypothetical protein [Roseicella aerolata]MCB4825042.1 hypothetical protein [Roseicella aerolata]